MLNAHSSLKTIQHKLLPRNLMRFWLQFSWMITISGKQNDNEVETSIVHLMQMYMFHIEVLLKSKYFYPGGQPSLTHPWAAPDIAIFFSSSVQLPCGRARKMVQLVGMLVNQKQIHIMIHKLIHIFHAYW